MGNFWFTFRLTNGFCETVTLPLTSISIRTRIRSCRRGVTATAASTEPAGAADTPAERPNWPAEITVIASEAVRKSRRLAVIARASMPGDPSLRSKSKSLIPLWLIDKSRGIGSAESDTLAKFGGEDLGRHVVESAGTLKFPHRPRLSKQAAVCAPRVKFLHRGAGDECPPERPGTRNQDCNCLLPEGLRGKSRKIREKI